MEIRTLLGVLSVVVNFIGYIPYFKDTLQKRTKPHVFTWLTWFLLPAIGFAVQVTNGAGPGSWVMGFTALASFVIFMFALKNGDKDITTADWISLSMGAIALLLWFFTKSPLLSIILITLADLMGGFFPTFRKSYMKPHEETISLYVLYVVAWALSLGALANFDFINAFAPIVFIFVNTAMVVLLVVRRKQLNIVAKRQ